jgi:hypothetical protein
MPKLMPNMTEALHPSELFALPWPFFDDRNTFFDYRNRLPEDYPAIREGALGSLGKVHLPDGLANELRRRKPRVPGGSAEAFIFT